MNNKLKVALGLTALGSAFVVDNSFAVPQTFIGNSVANLYGGNVQVQITVNNGLITAISTPVQPTGSNAQFADMAIPTLIIEALAAQSANIQGVSGASAISAAWKSSLASAIANAGSAIGVSTPTPSATPTVSYVPTSSVSGNTVCSTAAPTPVSTSTATTTDVIPDPTSTPSVTPSITPTERESTPTPTPTERESTPTPTPTITRTPTPIPTRTGEAGGEKDLIISTIFNGANSTVTTITKTIIQNQVVTCTTTNTITNTLTNTLTVGATPAPTITVTSQPVPGPTVTVTATPEPLNPSPTHPVIIKKKPSTTLVVNIIKCKLGKVVKRFAGSSPKCPKGYVKIK